MCNILSQAPNQIQIPAPAPADVLAAAAVHAPGHRRNVRQHHSKHNTSLCLLALPQGHYYNNLYETPSMYMHSTAGKRSTGRPITGPRPYRSSGPRAPSKTQGQVSHNEVHSAHGSSKSCHAYINLQHVTDFHRRADQLSSQPRPKSRCLPKPRPRSLLQSQAVQRAKVTRSEYEHSIFQYISIQ